MMLIILVIGLSWEVINTIRDSQGEVKSTQQEQRTLVVPADHGVLGIREAEVKTHLFSPESYPQFAKANPDASCATWDNGGLGWRPITDDQDEWAVIVWLPVFRFCGIPTPHRAKIRKAGEFYAPPDEWLSWSATQEGQ